MTRPDVRDWRLPVSIAMLGLAVMLLAGYTHDRFFPWVIAAFFAAMAMLVVLAWNGWSLSGVLGGGLIVGVGYRLYTNILPATQTGMGSQGLPSRIDELVEIGELQGGYYGSASGAPFDRLLHMTFASVTGVPGEQGAMLYSVLIAICFSLCAIAMLQALGISDERALGAVAILALVTTEGLRRAYWPREQVIAVLFFVAAMYVLIRFVQTPSRRDTALLIALVGGMVYGHRLPMAIFTAVVSVLIGLFLLNRVLSSGALRADPLPNLGILFLFAGVVVWAQQVYHGVISHFVRRIFRILARFEGDPDPQAITAEPTATAAEEALPGIIAYVIEYPAAFSLFVERGHGIWLLLCAGIAWLVVLIKGGRQRQGEMALLAATATGAAMTLIGAISIRGLNPTRPLHTVEPVFAVLIIGGVVMIREIVSRERAYDVMVSVILVLLVASQIFAMSAAPDYANSPRMNADMSEAAGKATVCEYQSGVTHFDRELGRVQLASVSSCEIETFGGRADSALFNAEIHPADHPRVAYRPHADVYHGTYVRYRLTWDPVVELQNDYHRVYDNEAVLLFEGR